MRLGRDDNSFTALFYDTSEVEGSQAEEAPHPPCLNHRKSAFKVADPRLRIRILDSTIYPSAMQVFLTIIQPSSALAEAIWRQILSANPFHHIRKLSFLPNTWKLSPSKLRWATVAPKKNGPHPLPESHTSPAKLGTLHNLVFSNIWDIIFNLKTVSAPDYLCSSNKQATFSFFSKDWNLWLKMKVQIRRLMGFLTEPVFLFLRLQGAHCPKTSETVTWPQ